MSSMGFASYADVSPRCSSTFVHLSTIASTAPKRRTQLYVTVREIKHWLWETRGLNNTPNLDGSFVFDQLAYRT